MNVYTKNKGVVKYLLLIWLLCGTLDALSAVIINNRVPAAAIFTYIAGGFFGKTAAAAGGTEMILYGVLFHYFIALVWTTLLFGLYPFFINIFRNRILLAIIYGIIIFTIMNLLIVPYLSHITTKPMKLPGILKNLAALVIAFGFPIAFIAASYYRKLTIVYNLKVD